MRGMQFDRILAGTALALVLTLSGQANAPSPIIRPRLETGVPVPEPANVPPPTAADIAKSCAERHACRTRHDVRNAARGRARPPPPPDRLRPPLPRQTPAPAAPRARRAIRRSGLRREAARNSRHPRRPHLQPQRRESAGVEAFYRDRNYAPLWVNNGAPTARATEAIAYLRGVDADGLEPSEYPAPDFKAPTRRDGGSRAQIHRHRADLRAPRANRPRALEPRQPGHFLQ